MLFLSHDVAAFHGSAFSKSIPELRMLTVSRANHQQHRTGGQQAAFLPARLIRTARRNAESQRDLARLNLGFLEDSQPGR